MILIAFFGNPELQGPAVMVQTTLQRPLRTFTGMNGVVLVLAVMWYHDREANRPTFDMPAGRIFYDIQHHSWNDGIFVLSGAIIAKHVNRFNFLGI